MRQCVKPDSGIGWIFCVKKVSKNLVSIKKVPTFVPVKTMAR